VGYVGESESKLRSSGLEKRILDTHYLLNFKWRGEEKTQSAAEGLLIFSSTHSYHIITNGILS
jgi:hypothetical protein